MRDAMTARHSAAVARYSREVAELLGLSEREQELIHTAGLFHDIGKFIFPDSILVADRKLTDERVRDREAPSRAGRQARAADRGLRPGRRRSSSATTSGSTAAATRTASPASDIPLGSRIIAVADTYDVMTARDSYRDPVSARRRRSPSSGASPARSSTPMVVDMFVEMIEQHGVRFRHTDETDFERELHFERARRGLRRARRRSRRDRLDGCPIRSAGGLPI